MRILLLVLYASLVAKMTMAWSVGDLVPLNVYLRVNQSTASSDTQPIPLPNDYNPHFATNKIALVPSIDFSNTKGENSNVMIRFEVGRGINKGTKWMVLKQLPSPTNQLRGEKHLTRVTFKFGYQIGAFGRFTSVRAFATYSDKPHSVLTLSYEWDEHRSFNPHIATTVISVVALASAFVIGHGMLLTSFTKEMQTIAVVRDREE
jgi:hypothetical protein